MKKLRLNVRAELIAAILAIVALVGSVVVYGALMVQVRIPASGNVYGLNLDVYSDEACTLELTSINWTNLSPGQNKTITCYLKSMSTVTSSLTLSSENWNPPQAVNYFSLSWDREGYRIMPGEVVAASLTLQVSSSVWNVTSFSVDIVLTAQEV